MKDNFEYYWSMIRDASPDAKRGVFVIIFTLALIFVPFGISHHYRGVAETANAKAANNIKAAKELDKQAHQKVQTAKYRMKNQAQVQKEVQKNVDDFTKAQLTLMQYKTKNSKVTADQAQEAQGIVDKMIVNGSILNDPDNDLIAPVGRSKGLSIDVSYSPSFSVYQDDIDVIFHLNGQMDKGVKPVYVAKGTYNLKHNKFEDFTYYTTKYAINFYNGQDQSVNNQHMTLAQQIAQERKEQKEKEAKERAAKKAAEEKKKAEEAKKKKEQAEKDKKNKDKKQDNKKQNKKDNKKGAK